MWRSRQRPKQRWSRWLIQSGQWCFSSSWCLGVDSSHGPCHLHLKVASCHSPRWPLGLFSRLPHVDMPLLCGPLQLQPNKRYLLSDSPKLDNPLLSHPEGSIFSTHNQHISLHHYLKHSTLCLFKTRATLTDTWTQALRLI